MNMHMDLIPITDEEFPTAFQEIHSYIRARKRYPILNCQKLLALIKTCCSLLLDPRSNYCVFTMRVGSNWYRFSIDGHDSEGNKKQISISDSFGSLINNLSSDIIKSVDSVCFDSLIKLFTVVIQHPGIDIEHKFAILNAENGPLKSIYDYYIAEMPEVEINKFLGLRKKFIIECIMSYKDKDHTGILDINIESLYDAYKYYIAQLIKSQIRFKRFPEIIKFLDDELHKYDDNNLVTYLIWNIITYNNQFLIKTKREIKNEVANYWNLIIEDQRKLILTAIKFSLSEIDLRDATFELGSYDLTGIDFRKAKTEIYATVPIKLKVGNSWSTTFDTTKILLREIRNPIEDPIYNLLNEFGVNINGVPLASFSDVLHDMEYSTLVIVTIDSFEHPDFQIVNDQIVNVDFSETEALLGRKYYPHKEGLVKLFRNVYESAPDDFPFAIVREQINIDLISNYMVNYVDEMGKSFFHKVYTVTNPDSFPKIKTRYLEKVSKLNLGDEFLGVKDLKLGTHIISSILLCEFVLKAIGLLVKKPIEMRGVYKLLWLDKAMSKPRSEPDAQPLIKTFLQPILEEKGVQISREITAANGSLDYLCSYTGDGLYKVGVELKNAHRTDADIVHGLTEQLPAYLKDEGTQDGIYLVLWYKNSNHPFPAKYDTPEELRHALQEKCPANYRIHVMVIDCTKKPTPSKL